MCLWLTVGLSFGRLKADSLQTNINFQSMCFVKCTSILWSVKGGFIRDRYQVWMITLSAYKYVAYISGIHNFLNQWSSCKVSINTCAQQRVKRRFQCKEEYILTVWAINLRLGRWQNESNATGATFSLLQI